MKLKNGPIFLFRTFLFPKNSFKIRIENSPFFLVWQSKDNCHDWNSITVVSLNCELRERKHNLKRKWLLWVRLWQGVYYALQKVCQLQPQTVLASNQSLHFPNLIWPEFLLPSKFSLSLQFKFRFIIFKKFLLFDILQKTSDEICIRNQQYCYVSKILW